MCDNESELTVMLTLQVHEKHVSLLSDGVLTPNAGTFRSLTWPCAVIIFSVGVMRR